MSNKLKLTQSNLLSNISKTKSKYLTIMLANTHHQEETQILPILKNLLKHYSKRKINQDKKEKIYDAFERYLLKQFFKLDDFKQDDQSIKEYNKIFDKAFKTKLNQIKDKIENAVSGDVDPNTKISELLGDITAESIMDARVQAGEHSGKVKIEPLGA